MAIAAIKKVVDEAAQFAKQQPKQAQSIVELANQFKLFHTPEGDAFAAVNERETYRIKSKQFRLLLRRLYRNATKRVANNDSLSQACEELEAIAHLDGPRIPVYLRLARVNDVIWYDLGDETRRVIRVARDGWSLEDKAPVAFWRSRGMAPLPEPERGGTLDELRSYVNISDDDWPLLLAAITYMGTGQYPQIILVIKGEQGSAKTFTCKVVVSLLDPREALLRGAPGDLRDLVSAARNSYVMAFDNISYIPPELSNAACRLSTGAGIGGRELYTDSEDAMFQAIRPQIFNGIPNLGEKQPDFLDRAIILELPFISDSKRLSEQNLWAEFQSARPRILGALLDLTVSALRRLPNTRLDRLPRMADFARWGLATIPEHFEAAYSRNQLSSSTLALSASPLVECLKTLLATSDNRFSGSTTQLLQRLDELAGDQLRRSRAWPKAANVLSNRLRQLAPNLRQFGIQLTWSMKHASSRVVTITMTQPIEHEEEDDCPF